MHLSQGDLGDPDAVTRIFAEVHERFGALDCFIANAGTWPETPTTLGEMDSARWHETVRANLDAVFLSTRAAIGLMRDGGTIVLVSSTAAQRGEALHADYAATKGAVAGFTQTLAIELAPRGIRVNAIGPGVIEVPRYFDRPSYTRESMGARIPLGRVGLPPDIATVAAFLASDGAAYMTGQVFYIDGGLTTQMGALSVPQSSRATADDT